MIVVLRVLLVHGHLYMELLVEIFAFFAKKVPTTTTWDLQLHKLVLIVVLVLGQPLLALYHV